MIKPKHIAFSEEGQNPTKVTTHLPYWLPIVQPKKKKKCCKKYKKGKRCGRCPNG